VPGTPPAAGQVADPTAAPVTSAVQGADSGPHVRRRAGVAVNGAASRRGVGTNAAAGPAAGPATANAVTSPADPGTPAGAAATAAPGAPAAPVPGTTPVVGAGAGAVPTPGPSRPAVDASTSSAASDATTGAAGIQAASAVTGQATPGTAATGAASPATSAQAPATDPQPIAAQIARHLTSVRTLRDGTQHTVLHLSPEHLGQLTLTVDVRAGAVALTVAGGEAALSALRDGLSDLRDQLGQSGLDLGDVTLRQDAGNPGNGGRDRSDATAQQWTSDGGRRDGSSPGGGSTPRGSTRRPDLADSALLTGTATLGSTGSLDVRV
jgi:flagellar hook-length control protein FliK